MAFRIEQNLSLMIPRVFPQWVDEQKMIDIFHQQHLGRVYKVSIIRMPDSKKRSYPIYQAFIYFSAWYENEIAYNFQQRIFGPQAQARVVYDDPWFWVAFENQKRRLNNNDKRLIRLGYQSYRNEQEFLAQDERIRQLENFNFNILNQVPIMPDRVLMPVSVNRTQAAEYQPNWYLSENFVMNTLESELTLTEPAISIDKTIQENKCIMDISGNLLPPKNWCSAEWTSFYKNKLVIAADNLLGEELGLTETAMIVAEAALKTDEDDHCLFR